ncbi:uncharacterized protein LOC126737068 [Anthonomus grandis grandis]|uniref:uncharacterized protein LOC126737068 n=1 Tax=Anthonomus grandis grandis TaxID=2921223 RepID=UPI0021653A19|nr:uncharacterized protein LOC126737068 [Anthonomus grandis grandis]
MILNIEKSEFFEPVSNMTPNSETVTKKDGYIYADEITKEKQRPPIYNPEDYALMLKKWDKKSSNGGLMSLYSTSSPDMESPRSQNNSFRDYRNPMLISSGSEMTLRQFGTVSELLAKLKTDLRLAFPSFVQEFVADPLDGVTLLIHLLRAIQLSQSNTIIHGSPGTTGKIPPSLQRRALLDELSCLQCLLSCCTRYSESLRKLISSSAGLFTVAVCIMSNVNKSRIIALQLLARACEPSIGGHSAVSEAMSTLRLRFGEPARFRFLVGMMLSTGGQKELVTSGLRFLNRFIDTSGSSQKRLYIQSELEQAGFDIGVIKDNMTAPGSEHLQEEILYWERNYISLDNIVFTKEVLQKENSNLKEKVAMLEKKVKALQDEKGILSYSEKSLKDRCSELQSEIRSLKSTRSLMGSYTKKRHDSTPNEDEGISSSERSLTSEDDQIYQPNYHPLTETNHAQEQNEGEEEEEEDDDKTTIDEVIEELRNIVNAESKEDKRIEEAQVAGKLKIHIDADDYAIATESEIVPEELHPKPPRRAKSLVHLFVPSDGYYYPKELFFENETPYTSVNGSDSLISASKYRDNHLEDKCDAVPKYHQELARQRTKSKSLDRVEDGLETMVDIVVTGPQKRPPTVVKSVSNVHVKSTFRPRFGSCSEDKQKMFLPPANEVSYYFPRLQEKKLSSAASFLIKRGHENAGLFSGQNCRKSRLGRKNGDFLSLSSDSMLGRVTDLPSGLY